MSELIKARNRLKRWQENELFDLVNTFEGMNEEDAEKLIANRQSINNSGLVKKRLNLRRNELVEDESGIFLFEHGKLRYEKKRIDELYRNAFIIVDRVAPGILEDPDLFSLIALNSSAIELAAKELFKEDSNVFRENDFKVLIGTTPSNKFNALIERIRSNGFHIILIANGLIDICYQMAKAIVDCYQFTGNPSGSEPITSYFDGKQLENKIRETKLVNHIFETVINVSHFGLTRPLFNRYSYVVENDIRTPKLKFLIRFCERFFLAHEYAHFLLHSNNQRYFGPISYDKLNNTINKHWLKELEADKLASFLVVKSGLEFDKVAPEIALEGCFFSLQCYDLFYKSLKIISHNEEDSKNDVMKNESTHPPFKLRYETLLITFKEIIQKCYKDLPDKMVLKYPDPINHNQKIFDAIFKQLEVELQFYHKGNKNS